MLPTDTISPVRLGLSNKGSRAENPAEMRQISEMVLTLFVLSVEELVNINNILVIFGL